MTPRERAEEVFAGWVREGVSPLEDAYAWMNPEDKEPFIAGIADAIQAALDENCATAESTSDCSGATRHVAESFVAIASM